MLNSLGYSVQLKHDPTEERACEGRVVVSTADGIELARHDSAMTNRNYYERPALFEALSKTVQSKLSKMDSDVATEDTTADLSTSKMDSNVATEDNTTNLSMAGTAA